MGDKPRLRPDPQLADHLLLGVAVVASVAGFVLAASGWSELPDRIPLHFDGAGTPDRWGGKVAIWWLPSIGLALVAGLTVLQRFPWVCNIPVRVTEANALRQYRLVNRLLGSLSALLSLTFAYLVWGVGEAASTPGATLAAPMIPLLLLTVTAVIVVYLVLARRSA